jgi:hypothetical protein
MRDVKSHICRLAVCPCTHQAIVLIGVRWVLYKLKRWHYYLLGAIACAFFDLAVMEVEVVTLPCPNIGHCAACRFLLLRQPRAAPPAVGAAQVCAAVQGEPAAGRCRAVPQCTWCQAGSADWASATSSAQVMFAYSAGPLAWSIVAFRNSLVFHSLDKASLAALPSVATPDAAGTLERCSACELQTRW